MSVPPTPPQPADVAGVAAAPQGRALFLAVFPSIMLPMFLAALDQTIVATALPAIAGSLGDVERISWVVVSYLIATTIAAPVYGRLGDAIGRKRMMFVALAVFVGASLLCAAAGSVLMLTAARLLQGLGGGGLMTLSQALIAESVPPRQRGRYQGYLSGMYATAATFGPVAGGWLTQQFGWRSVFLVNLPLGLIAALLVMRLPNHAAGGRRVQFDVWGTVFFTGFVAPVLLALEQGQRFTPGVLPMVALLLAVAATCLVLLLRQERRAPAPLLPIVLLRQAGIWRADMIAACVAAQTVSLVSFLPMYLQVVRGADAAHSGFLLLPLTVGIAAGSFLTGRTIAATGRTAIIPSIGLAIAATTLVSLGLFAPHLPTERLTLLLGLASFCTGGAMPVVQMTVQTVAGPKFLGAAAASVQFARSVGAAFGTALVGAVLFALLAAQDQETASLFADLVEAGPRVLASLPEARRVLVQAEIADAFRGAFLTVSCFTTTGMLFAWWLPVRRI
ncbi:MAG: MFS transporter [Rhodospirillales bacterium 69-11]|nr:MFS transporter [Rhodospirillales bacterium]MBN8925839.1 MFS transporter [Rhodospirillales bacterium]OJW26154.1 MAG: MFS transporter [Rhodospirillales bacterium 69-11]